MQAVLNIELCFNAVGAWVVSVGSSVEDIQGRVEVEIR